jgi:quinoprotein glucose dehydrogenase
MSSSEESPGFAGRWAGRLLGVVLALIGLVLAGGGAWLAVIGGSAYYVLAGLGLLIAGGLVFRGRLAGVAVYALVFVGTLVWAVW